MEQSLTKKQRREQRKQQQEQKRTEGMKKYSRWRIVLIAVSSIVVVIGIAWFLWSSKGISSSPPSEVVSENGLHWHADLSMKVKGKDIDIPKDIGIGRVHLPVHTHDEDGVIHMEFEGRVTRDDLTLGRFFQNWGKDMKKFGTLKSMKVNGSENAELENYQMKDEDKIELF